MKKTVVALALLLSSSAFASISQPGGFNNQFRTGPECQAVFESDLKNSKLSDLKLDLGDLDAQIKLVTNSDEDKDFRLQVLTTAESTRQGVAYLVREIKAKDSVLAQKVVKACGLERIENRFDFSALLEELL